MNARHALARLVAGMLAFWGVLLVFGLSVLLALGLSGLSPFGGLPASSALDYRTHDGEVRPLSDEYLSELLGRPLPGLRGASGALAAASNPGASSPPGDTAAPLQVVDHEATNDDIADALVIAAVPFTGRTSAARAGRESGDPASCSGSGPTLWYRYVATTDRLLQATAIGSGGSMGVGVFTRPAGAFQQEACDTSIGSWASATFRAEPGTEYWFQVTASSGPSRVAFSLGPLGTTERVSLSSDGGDPNSVSHTSAISADGRYVAFESWATNLVPGDTNDAPDVFVRDRATGRTERVSVSSDGAQGNGNSGVGSTAISANGRYVVYLSYATNLVPGDTNQARDTFVHDRATGRTERVSVATDGSQGRWPMDTSQFLAAELGCRVVGDEAPTRKFEDNVQVRDLCHLGMPASISDDGRYVAFASWLHGLSDDDRNRNQADGTNRDLSGYQRTSANMDVFVRDRLAGTTTLVSVGPDGPSNGPSRWPAMSGDGTYVSFASVASNLVPGDTNGVSDIFRRSLRTGRVERVSVSTAGVQSDGNSEAPALSRDGRIVAFESTATNIGNVPLANPGQLNVFAHDVVTGETTVIGINSVGDEGALGSLAASISADGRLVAFESASREFGGEVQGYSFVYVHDRLHRTTSLAAISSTGEPGDHSAWQGAISADGQHIVFTTSSTNFDDRDRNALLPDQRESLWAGRDIYVHSRSR